MVYIYNQCIFSGYFCKFWFIWKSKWNDGSDPLFDLSSELYFQKIIILCFVVVVVFLTLLRYTNGLKNMLDRYDKLMGTLNEAETKLLDDHIQELGRVFKSGHRRLSWNSLGNTIFKWP